MSAFTFKKLDKTNLAKPVAPMEAQRPPNQSQNRSFKQKDRNYFPLSQGVLCASFVAIVFAIIFGNLALLESWVWIAVAVLVLGVTYAFAWLIVGKIQQTSYAESEAALRDSDY